MSYLVEKQGKGGISAKIVADSISEYTGTRIITYELEYPRFIHSEFMTHRMISKNAASSRAIPVEKNIEMIRARTAMPIHWGKNQPGMSAKEECNVPFHMGWGLGDISFAPMNSREDMWKEASNFAIMAATAFHKAGYHKQIVNRLLEPFCFIKVVATGTEDGWSNLFNLRCHPDAQPEFQELARVMLEATNESASVELDRDDWHVPYFRGGFWNIRPTLGQGDTYPSLQEALKISASCCAQVSYRKNDDSIEKADVVYDRLVRSVPVHASPFEHQARPLYLTDTMHLMEKAWPSGKFTRDQMGNCYSGNFKNWFQYRQMIPGNVCEKYEGLK